MAVTHPLLVLYYPTLPSTATQLREQLPLVPVGQPVLVSTPHQTQGRGASWGRRWHSTPGQALTLSWGLCLPVNTPQAEALRPWLAQLAGAATCQALLQHWPALAEQVHLKPINDVYTPQGKLGGLLVESQLVGTHLSWRVGLGLNRQPLPHELAVQVPYATASLQALLGEVPSLADADDFSRVWASALASHLQQALQHPNPHTWTLAQWRIWCRPHSSRRNNF